MKQDWINWYKDAMLCFLNHVSAEKASQHCFGH